MKTSYETVQAAKKNIKHLMETVSNLEEKLDSKQPTPAEGKERMEKIFEFKKIGRPVGSFEDKQKQYLRLLNENKIKTRKQQTLDYYQIYKDGEKYMMRDSSTWCWYQLWIIITISSIYLVNLCN